MAKNRKSAERQQPVEAHKPDTEPSIGAMETSISAQRLVSGPAVGLVNLGNTCFFNSALQLLLACPDLHEPPRTLCASVGRESAPSDDAAARSSSPAQLALGRGPLGFALQQALLNVNGPPGSKAARHHPAGGKGTPSYNPQALLAAVCRTAPQFKNRQQHDSHELMRLMLDALQEEEKRAAELMTRSSSRKPPTVKDASSPREPAAEPSSGPQSTPQPAAAADAIAVSPSSEAQGDTARAVTPTQPEAGVSGAVFETATAVAAAACSVTGAEAESGGGSSSTTSIPAPTAPAPPSSAPTSNTTTTSQSPSSPPTLSSPSPSLSSSASSSLIAALFGGELLSRITCGDCGHCSQSVESFFDLSLPIPEELPEVDAAVGTKDEGEGGVGRGKDKKGAADKKAGGAKKLSKKEIKQLEKDRKMAAAVVGKGVGAESAVGKGKGKAGKSKSKGNGPGRGGDESGDEDAQGAEAGQKGTQEEVQKGPAGQGKGKGKAAAASEVPAGKKLTTKQKRKAEKEERRVKIAAARVAKKAQGGRQDPQDGQDDDDGDRADELPPPPQSEQPAAVEAAVEAVVAQQGKKGEEVVSPTSKERVPAVEVQTIPSPDTHSGSQPGSNDASITSLPPTQQPALSADEGPTQSGCCVGILGDGAATASGGGSDAEAGSGSEAGSGPTAQGGVAEAEAGKVDVPGAPASSLRAAPVSVPETAAQGDSGLGMAASSGGAQEAAVDIPEGSPQKSSSDGDDGVEVERLLSEDTPPPAPAAQPSPAAVPAPAIPAAAAATAGGGMAARKKKGSSAARAAGSGALGNGAGIEAGTAPSLTAAAAAPVLPVLAARRPVLDVAACLQAFFAAEVVTWACPREKAAAAAAATAAAAAVEADGVMPAASVSGAMNNLPPTPIRKQVSWSPSMPQVFYVPGSAEQRGTDLEEALRGREPFFRPAKAQGAPFIIQAQLDEWDTDKLHLQVLPLAGSTRAADLLAAAAAAATAAATARGDAAAAAVAAAAGSSPAPMSPVLSTILSSSPRGNGGTSSSYGASVRGKGSPTQSSTGGRTVGCSTAIGQSLPFSELGLPISALDVGVASRVGSFEAARRVQAAAQLAMDCAADLMAGPGGLLHLLDMSAGGFELSEGLPQSPSSPRSHGGSGRIRLLLRGKYPKAPYCTESQNRANRVKGAASSSSQSRGCVGGQTALAQAGGKTGKAEKNSAAAAGPPAAAPGAKEVACQQTSVSASVPIAMSTTRRPRRLNIGSSDEEEEDSDHDDGSRGSGKGARGGTAATWEYPTALRRPAEHPAFAHLCRTTTADDSTISSSSASSASSSASGSPSSSTSPSPSPSPPVSAENSDAEEGATATSAVRRLHHRHGRALAAAVAAAADSFATAVGVTDSGDGDFGGGNSTAAYDNTIAANGSEAAVHLDGAACALGGAGGGSTTAVGDEMAMRQMHGVNLDPAITHHQYHVHHHHHHHGCSHHHDTQHKHQNPTNQEDHHQQQLQQQQQAVEGEHDKGQRPCLTPEQTLDRVSPHAGGETAVDVGDPLFDMDDLTPPGLSQPPTTHSDGSTTEVPYRPGATAESILSLLAPLPLPKLQSGSNARLDEPSLAMTNSSISAAVAAAANSTFCHPSSSSCSSGALKQQQQPPADMQPASSDGDCDGGGASSSHSNSGGKHVNASEASTAPAAVSSPSSHSIPIPQTSSPKTTGPQPLPPLALPTEASTPAGPTTTTTAAAAASPSPRALRPLLSPPHAATGGLRGGLRRTPSGVVSVSGAGGVGSYYRASSKQYFLRRAPEVLLLHLKRFAIDNRGRLRKVDKHVGFQTMLDLGPFLAAATTATTNTSPPNVMSPAAVVPADAAAAAAGGAAYLSPFLSGNANVPLSRPDAGVEESAAAQFATDTPAVATDQTPAPSVTSPPARSLLAAAMEPQTGSNTEQQLQGSPSGSSFYVYDLVGLVEHSGEMRYGHYVAYVKRAIPATVAAPSSCSAASSSRNSVDGEGSRNGASGTTTGHSNGSSGHGGGSTAQWYHCSDTTVRPVGEAQVLRAQAYLLLYVRRRSEA